MYLLGAGPLLLRLAIGTVCANRLTGASCAAPVTVGLLRPRVILPECWREWPPPQLDAVLIHERAHARRRDPLIQWLALLNRALFWFHPLAWWLERRLIALAEEACDAAVLAQGHSPRDYSEYLLDLARAVQRAGMRVNLPGMSMPGSHLPQRIRRMMAGVSAPRVTPARMACAAIACAVCSATFAAGTLRRAASGPLLLAQTAAAPKFEVASIKPCKDEDPGGRGQRKGGSQSPGRLSVNCQSVAVLIQEAYVFLANGRSPDWKHVPVTGGPAWIDSDRYTIDARSDGQATRAMMQGPMMQTLLEDRFKLKTHRETREMPVYLLTVARGGPKLQPSQQGSCTPLDFEHPPPPPEPGQPFPRVCGGAQLTNHGLDMYGTTMAEFCRPFLSDRLDRDVVDRTGIAGRFNIHLDLSGADLGHSAAPVDPAAPVSPADPSSIFAAIKSAVQKVGLKLEPAKGFGEFLVIDHVEKPSAN